MTTPDHNRSPGHRDAFPAPPSTPAEAAIAAEAARYGRIFAISYNAVLNAIGAGNWPGPAADRAATWFAGRMTDRRLAGKGLDNLNAMLDAETAGSSSDDDAAAP